jgi:hypothetical protein
MLLPKAIEEMIMNSKVLTSAGIFFALAAAGLPACSQAADPGPTLESDGTSEALQTVIGCQTQAFACTADAQAPSGLTSCNSGLRACLASLLPDASGPLPLPVPGPAFDAGLRPPVLTLPAFDAGLPFRNFDAGIPRPPPPVLPDAGVSPLGACIADLLSCLTTTFDVTKCGTDARACLTAADKSRCDAQQTACTASGAPKALCDAQRAACL